MAKRGPSSENCGGNPEQLSYIQGRENVENVCMDLSTFWRSFAKDYFPNAFIIANKFHEVRLSYASFAEVFKASEDRHKRAQGEKKITPQESLTKLIP